MTDAYGLYLHRPEDLRSTPLQTLYNYVAAEPNEHWEMLLTEV